MKKIFLLVALVVLITSCAEKPKITIEITNNSSFDRTEEIIEIDVFQLGISHNWSSYFLLNEKGEEIPCQNFVYNHDGFIEDMLLVPVTVPANSSVRYTIKAGEKPSEFPRRTFGRVIPERKDDFAWENDRIAFRVYGPALANENPSNGVDLWLKKTNDMIVDKFYKEELEDGKSYHVDRGEGLDCYKVGHTLGAGGISPFADGRIWVGDHYTTAKVLDSGILRTVFELTYDSIKVNDIVLSQKIIVSLDAGSQLNRATVNYTGDFETIDLAAGIYLHDELGNIRTNHEKGYVAYGENAVSDAGVPAGRNYVGVVFPNPIKEIFQDTEHLAGIASYEKPGTNLTYYFGGGWSQWGFENDEAWFKYMEEFSDRIAQPLKWKVIE